MNTQFITVDEAIRKYIRCVCTQSYREKCLGGGDQKSFVLCKCPSKRWSWQSLRIQHIGLTATGRLLIKTNPCTSHGSKSLPYGWKRLDRNSLDSPILLSNLSEQNYKFWGARGHSRTLIALPLIFIRTLSHFLHKSRKCTFFRLLLPLFVRPWMGL